MKNLADLTKSELEIMKILWDAHEDLLLQEMLPMIADKYNKVWKRQTLATFLSKLIEKGYVESYRQGRYFYYKPIIPESAYEEKERNHFLNFWYNGSVSNLFAAFCKTESLSEEKVKEIEKLIDGMDE